MIRKFIATAALAGTVVLAASSGAFATASNPPKDPVAAAASKAEKCAKAPDVIAHIKANQEKRTAAIAKLQDAEAKATTAGKTDRVAKIEARIAKVKNHSAKAAERLTKLEAKVADKCGAKPAA